MNTPNRFLHADAPGGFRLPTTPVAPKMKSSPAELPLTLTADVLRLPYTPAVRLVLAEIVSLYAANGGCCDASDPHFAARLSINKDTVSVAIKQLEAEGLISKTVVAVQGGKYRTLTPNLGAIAAKAATNPYPEVEVNTRRNFRRVQDGNSGLHTPEIPVPHAGNSGFHTPEFPISQPGISGGNTYTINIPEEYSNESSSAAHVAAAGREAKVEPAPVLAREVSPAEGPDASASHTRGARPKSAKSRPAKPERTSRPELPFLESDIGTPEAFAAAFAGTDYELANLAYYFEKITAWRQKGEVPRRKDWKATAKQFFLNDISSNSLVLAPGVQQHAAAASSTDPGTRPAGSGYRSKYDQ
ncbi:helix-turn-helix domain-containing protein [Hymenobacter glacieicola]|uniref:Helix-turn-helix domain-containing protein n=1 Tax=Hymenobacter glacieicola TaxID=1562124 RepID=A0ABQ1WM95_9BACT|nr:helix-turn-helix domain-containing protein [Hymenobacter glacieicola]GGG33977.1 hypothetical protein GCM10011378_08010 [Hymenobacter glacieicola]